MNQDEIMLASLGYKQDFKRAFSRIELFGVSFSIVGVFPSIAGVLLFAIPYGGPVAMVWGWTVCSFFLLFIAAAIAELGSAAPTAGGLYFWTFRYASPGWRHVLAWLVGYTNTIAYAVGITSVEWTCAVSLLAGASIGSDMTYTPTTAQTFGVFTALLFCHVLTASLSTSILARLQGLYIACNILLSLGVIIALSIATPTEFKNTASYAFGHFENFSLWPNGFAFVLSFLAPLWTVGAFDASTHISEEASNASYAVPFATISSPLIAIILGFGINVAITFCMGTDLGTILENPIAQPFATILYNSFGKHGTLAVWSIVVFVQFIMGASTVTACSRQIWAFSRDGVLPFSKILYRMNHTTRTPIYAVCAAAIIAFVVGLMVFAGPVAISAIFSACVVAQYISLSIPILCRLLGGQKWVPGVFDLGRFGPMVDVVAVVWMAFSIVILCFPGNPAPTAQEMNYTVLVIGGWIFLCLLYYVFPVYGGMHWFKGPVANINSAEAESEGSVDEKVQVEVRSP